MSSHVKSKSKASLKRTALSVAVSSVLAPASFVATPVSAAVLEEVVVTATRRSEGVQDIPYNLSAVTGDDLAKRGVEDLTKLVRTVPGLTAVDNGARNNSPVTIRGLSVSNLDANDNGGNGGVVSTYVNDTPTLVDLKLFDINRVEVLRGPQGTLFGANSLGGTIRYITNKPDPSELTGEITGRAYSTKESESLSFGTTAVVNIPLAGNVALRGAFDYVDDAGFVDYPLILSNPGVDNSASPGEDVNTEETLSGRVSLLVEFNDSVEATLSHYFQNQETGGRQAVNPGFTADEAIVPGQVEAGFVAGDYDSTLRYAEPNDRETAITSLELTADLGGFELSSISSYSTIDEDGSRDQTDLLVASIYEGYADFPQFSAFTRDLEDLKTFVQEVRLVSNGDGPIDWIAGVYYEENENNFDTREFAPGLANFFEVDRPDDLEFIQFDKSETTEAAIFGELGFSVTDEFKVTLGARYFEVEQDVSSGSDIPIANGTPGTEINVPLTKRKGDKDSDAIFKFNASYDIDDDRMMYFTFSQGYRRGGSNPVPDFAQEDGVLQAIPEEDKQYSADTVDNFEIGLRSTFADGAVILNGAVYYLDWQDIQSSGLTVANLPITVNAGEARSRGLELELKAAVTDNFNISSGLAYIDTELTEDASNIGGLKGDKVAGVPELQFTVDFSYLQMLSNGMELEYQLDVSYSDETLTRAESNAFAETLDDYTIANASVTLSSELWDASVYIDNLTDEYAITGNRGAEEYGAQGQFDYINRPFTAGIRASYRF